MSDTVTPERTSAHRLRPWHAWLALASGGLAAQITSALALMMVMGPQILQGNVASQADDLLAHSLPALACVLTATEGTLVFAAVVPVLLLRCPLAHTLGLKSAPASVFLLGVLGALGASMSGDLLAWLLLRFAQGFSTGALAQLLRLLSVHSLWALWPLLALLPGIAEELFFRGLFQRALRNTRTAILISGVVFAVYHLDPPHVAATLPLGLYLGWLAARTDSTLVAMTAHVANNTIAILMVRIAPTEALVSDPRSSPPLLSAVLGSLLAAGCGAAIVLLLRRVSRRSNLQA